MVTLRSLLTLRPQQWIGDEAINCYLSLLTKQPPPFNPSQANRPPSACFSTFFYPSLCRNGYNYQHVAGWGNRHSPTGSIFSLTYLFIPIHTNNSHWTAVVVHLPTYSISYLDSLGNPGSEQLQIIQHYLADEFLHQHNKGDSDHANDNNHIVPPPTWHIVPIPTPQQTNNDDCGAYMCFFANRLFQFAPLEASPEDISLFRDYIALSILTATVALV
jgi:Ulp1 family protease